jgi:hypothetical protein
VLDTHPFLMVAGTVEVMRVDRNDTGLSYLDWPPTQAIYLHAHTVALSVELDTKVGSAQ